MSDQIEVLRRLIKRAGESADFTVSDAREADELLAALSAREGGEAWPLRARVWNRQSTQEWVLEIEGTIGDSAGIWRHPQPLTIGREDVPGLPTLYAAQPASHPSYQSATDSAGIGSTTGSQQGEKRTLFGVTGVELPYGIADAVAKACEAVENGVGRSELTMMEIRRLRELANPTGDRVRSYTGRQPTNGEAYRIHQAVMAAKPGGDFIDHGLSVTQELERQGFGLVLITAALDQEKGR